MTGVFAKLTLGERVCCLHGRLRSVTGDIDMVRVTRGSLGDQWLRDSLQNEAKFIRKISGVDLSDSGRKSKQQLPSKRASGASTSSAELILLHLTKSLR